MSDVSKGSPTGPRAAVWAVFLDPLRGLHGEREQVTAFQVRHASKKAGRACQARTVAFVHLASHLWTTALSQTMSRIPSY